MLGFIADSLSTATSVLFPVYASYKALRSSDPAQLTPWLMYWTTLSLCFASESVLHPVLRWVPLYPWMRLGLHLYLVLPGQQGSIYIYRNYIHPFLERHEQDVDHFITNAHDSAKRAGLGYLQQAIEYVKVNALHMAPREATPPPQGGANASYSQILLSRFTMPSARAGAAAAVSASGSNDLLALLGTAMHQVMSPTKSRDTQIEELSASGALIPSNLTAAERSTFIATRQDRLKTLLQAYDKEALESSSSPVSPSSTDLLKKSRSEAEFVDLAHEEVPDGSKRPPVESRQSSQGGWGSWMAWGSPKQGGPSTPDKKTQ